MSKGELVPDGLVVEMVKGRLREDSADSFVMDGFPRTLPQAEALEKALRELDRPLDAVIFLKIEEELLVRRLVHRRTCRRCGKIWNVLTMAERTEMCPECGGELDRRSDDAESVIRNRIDVYRGQTEPLISWYAKKGILRSIDAVNAPEETFKEIQVILSR